MLNEAHLTSVLNGFPDTPNWGQPHVNPFLFYILIICKIIIIIKASCSI